MRQQVDRRIQLGSRELGMELRHFDARSPDAQVGVVRDGFNDRRRQLVVMELHEPVVGDLARARARRGPLRGDCDVGIARALMAAASGGFFRMHAAGIDRDQPAQRRGDAEPRRDAVRRCAMCRPQCPRLMLCLMMM